MINDIKDLTKLFKLCRAQGVDKFRWQGLEIDFGMMSEKMSGSSLVDPETDMTDDELAFYSSPQGQAEIDKRVGLKS